MDNNKHSKSNINQYIIRQTTAMNQGRAGWGIAASAAAATVVVH